jgi:hypothetical protein
VQVAIELVIVPVGDFIQMIFEWIGPVIGIAIAGSIAFLFLKACLKWIKIL